MTEMQVKAVMKSAINAMTQIYLHQKWEQQQYDALNLLQWAMSQPIESERSLWRKRKAMNEVASNDDLT